MKNSSKKLLLLSVLLSSQLVYAEDDAKKLCNQEIKKEIIDKTIVDKYCYETAKELENKKEYGRASWYYLLSHNDKYNITNLKEYISLKNSDVIYGNIAHSYVLNDDMKNAEILYKEFLKVYDQPNDDIQYHYKILFKLYPDKKEQLTKGLELWNEVYKPLLPIDELNEKYIDAIISKNHKEAIKYLEEIINIKEKVIGSENLSILNTYTKIGPLYYKNYDDKKALENIQKILLIQEKFFGIEHEETISTYHDIGIIYKSQKKYKESLEYLEKSLKLSEKFLGISDIETISSYEDIGKLYSTLGNDKNALEYYNKVLSITKEKFGLNEDTAIAYDNIGNIYENLDDYKHALEYYTQALEIREKVLGTKHKGTIKSYDDVAYMYFMEKDDKKALEYFSKVLENSENNITTYTKIGDYYKNLGKYGKALEFYEKDLDNEDEDLKNASSDRGLFYYNVAYCYEKLSNEKDALKYAHKALKIQERILGMEHIDTATSYNMIGSLHITLGNDKKALEYFNKAVKIREKKFGEMNLDIAETYNHIGYVYSNLNEYTEALEYLNKALATREKVLGIDHKDTAFTYKNIGYVYSNLDNYSKSLDYLNRALKVFEEELGIQDINTITLYDKIGDILYNKKDNPKAFEFYSKAYNNEVKKNDQFGKEIDLKSFSEISEKYENIRSFEKAIEFKKKDIKEKESNSKYSAIIKDYKKLAKLYQIEANFKGEIECFIKVLEIEERLLGIKHPDIAINYIYIASIYQKLNDYPKALEYYDKALSIQEKVVGKEHIDTAQSYNNIGLVYQELNNYKKALEYHNKALAIREKVLGVENEDTADSYQVIGIIYFELKDYKKSLEYLNKALLIWKNSLDKNYYKFNNTFYTMIEIYNILGDEYGIMICTKNILEISEKLLESKQEYVAQIYDVAGMIYTGLKDYEKALEYLKKALILREKAFGVEDTDTAKSYHNIGILYQAINDYPKALNYHNKAIDIIENNSDKNDLKRLRYYEVISEVYKSLGDYQNEIKYLQKILKRNDKVLGTNNETTGTSYYNIGSAYQAMQDHPNAYKYLKKSFDIFINNRDKNFTILDNKQKLKYLESNSDKLESLLLSANAYIQELNKNGDEDKAKKIKEDSLNDWLNYKGAIFDGENSIAILYEKIEDKNVKAKIEELNSLKQQLSKQYQTLPEPNEIDKYKLRIKELEKNISDVEIYLSSQVDEFKEELGLRNVKYQDISKYLNDNEIYVDFSRTKDNYFIFSLDNKNNVTFEKVDKEITNKIDENIKLFRENVQSIVKSQTILSKDKLDSLNKDAKIILSNLYDNIVVNNLANKIDKFDNKKSLVFSLDGILNYLPLEALYDKQTNQYLIEQKEIKYVPSGREYIRLLNKKDLKNQSSQNVTMFTNPDYGLKLEPAQTKSVLMTPNTRSSQFENKALFSMEFKPLPGTQEEANVISKLYTNINDYNKDKATSQNLLKIKSPKILHISTHGFFLNDENIENPMLKSGLAFAGANMARIKGDSQGVMTGLKLAGLNLNDTQLVVLSACETGLGDIKGSEGVTGLNKAFIKAGARNIVMSLWSVADKETAELMQDFYQNVKETNKYQESLKESKMKMIKQDVHPYYWSAFIMNGI